MKFKTPENFGVSPVIGIILIVAVSVALVVLASTLVFDITGNVNEPSTGYSVNIESQQQSDNILVSVNRNPDLERVFVRGDGIDGEQEIADSEGETGTVSISPSSTEGTVEVVGETVDGGEQVLETEEYEDYSGTGSGKSADGNSNNGDVSGVVKINPPIDGANVKAVKADGTAIATDVTDSNGEYKLGASPSEFEKVVVNVNGTDELSNPLYTSGIKMADSANVNFNFDETNKITTNVNGDGTDEFIVFGTDSNGNKLIGNIHQLQAMDSDLSASYKLVKDIDASGTENWNNERGFEPIGSRSNRFSGELDGQGYKIQGLHIDRSSTDDVGLFASTNINSEIKNVVLSDINITGSNTVGGLIGYGEGTVLNSHTEGRVKGDGAVGGLVGGFGSFFGSSDDSIISNSHSIAEVNGSGDNVGGLVGVSISGGGTGSITISNSYATGSVIGGRYTGGLVGQATNITISGSYATGSVTSDDRSVGGLVGKADVNNEGRILDSYSTGSVTGNDNRVGGLIGYNAVNVSGSYATGSVTGVNGTGGLIGYNNDDAHVLNSYATGSVDGDTIVGGFVGYSGGIDVSNSYATGSVSGNSVVGGFIGSNTGSFGGNIYISDSYATGSVSGDSKVGGFVADAVEDRYDDVDVSDSYWDTEKTGQSSSAVLSDSNGLKTSEMQGISAESNMDGFDFGSSGDWNTANDQYPVLKALE